MSSIIKTTILSFLLLINATHLIAKPLDDRDFRISVAKETDKFYRKMGLKRGWEYYIPFVNSSYRTAKNFPGYPADNFKDRVLKGYCMGSNESYLKYNFVNINIPGVKYASGKVRRFSLDYTWVGLNQDNIPWTYEVAKDIQANRKITTRAMTKEAREIINSGGVKIPKNLTLRKIDLKDVKTSYLRYKQLISIGKTPNEINRIMEIDFTEDTAEQLDSALIYRMLVELDRSTRGWSYNLQNEDLYEWLTQRVN